MANESGAKDLNAQLNTNFDIKRLAGAFLANWYWLVIAGVLAVMSAWIYLRYTPPIYAITSSMLFQPENELQQTVLNNVPSNSDNVGDKLLYNEIFVITSKDLVSDVVSTLNLNIHYYVKGNVRESELYKRSPIQLTPDSVLVKSGQSREFMVRESSNGVFEVKDGRYTYKIAANRWLKLKTGGQVKVDYSKNKERVAEYLGEHIRVLYEPLGVTTAEIKNNLKVVPADGRTSLLSLSVTDEIPQRGLDFLNTLIYLYHRNELENLNFAAQKQKEFIAVSMGNLQEELRGVDVKVEDIKQSNATIDINSEASAFFQNKVLAEQQLGELNNQRLSLNNLRNDLTKYASDPQVIAGVGLSDPNLMGLIGEYNDAVKLASNLRISDGEQSPKLARIESRINTLRSSLLDAIQYVNRQLDVNIQRNRMEASRYGSKIYAAPQVDKTLKEATRNYTILQQMYLMLFQKDLETDIKSFATTNRSKVVVAPNTTNVPIKPIPRNVYLICLFAGILIPASILTIKELLNNKIYNEKELQAITNIPIVGSVSKDKSGATVVIGEKKRSAIAEQFRLIRTNLEFFNNGSQKKTMMISSSFPGEGKSFIAVNLALTLALGGKKVIILEFDLRKPKISEYLNISREGGISGYLAGLCGLDKVVKPSGLHENLYVANCGPVPPNPGELLISPRTNQLIEDLQEMFDVLVLDTAPLGLVSDALVLAKYTNLNLLIIRQDYTFKSQVADITRNYNEGRLPNTALVFNCVEMKKKYGYRYGYGYGYGNKGYYIEDEEKEVAVAKKN